MSMFYYNARSLFPKLDELRLECVNRKPDVICVVQAWIDDSFSDNELLMPGYQIHRHDHRKRGCGVAIYVHLLLHVK